MHFAATSVLFGLLATIHASHSFPGPCSAGMESDTTSVFSLAMKVNGTYNSLDAAYFEGLGVILQAKPSGEYLGTLAYRNTSDTNDSSEYFPDSVILNLTDTPDVSAPPGLYGLVVAQLGDAHGAVSYVSAIEGEQQFEFAVTNNSVYHELTAAPQSWFACSATVKNVTGVFLSWGLYNTDGSAPTGCQWTDVIPQWNVPKPLGLKLL